MSELSVPRWPRLVAVTSMDMRTGGERLLYSRAQRLDEIDDAKREVVAAILAAPPRQPHTVIEVYLADLGAELLCVAIERLPDEGGV